MTNEILRKVSIRLLFFFLSLTCGKGKPLVEGALSVSTTLRVMTPLDEAMTLESHLVLLSSSALQTPSVLSSGQART